MGTIIDKVKIPLLQKYIEKRYGKRYPRYAISRMIINRNFRDVLRLLADRI